MTTDTDEPVVLALVGATGGAGTTRLAVESAATLAGDGLDVAVLDGAYATQGLAAYVSGRIDPDATACCADDEPLESGLVSLPLDAPGRVVCLPAYAPFERVARAKRPAAAERLETLVGEATSTFDAVVVDTPPVAANQAVAAVSVADRVALVTPDSRRGKTALPRAADRLRDIGVTPDREVANAGVAPAGGDHVDRAPLTVPASDTTAPAEAPVSPSTGAFGTAVADLVETALDRSLDREDGGGLGDYVPGLSG